MEKKSPGRARRPTGLSFGRKANSRTVVRPLKTKIRIHVPLRNPDAEKQSTLHFTEVPMNTHRPTAVIGVLCLCLGLLAAAPMAWSDTPETGTAIRDIDPGRIEGVVKDAATGQIIRDAYVYVEGSKQAAMTNDAGKFYLEKVPAGNGVLKASRKGYKPIELQVQIEHKKTSNYTVQLKAVPKPVQEDQS
jgi:hypothetical protein